MIKLKLGLVGVSVLALAGYAAYKMYKGVDNKRNASGECACGWNNGNKDNNECTTFNFGRYDNLNDGFTKDFKTDFGSNTNNFDFSNPLKFNNDSVNNFGPAEDEAVEEQDEVDFSGFFEDGVDVPLENKETLDFNDWDKGNISDECSASNTDSWWESSASNAAFGETEGNTEDSWGSCDGFTDDMFKKEDSGNSEEPVLASFKNIAKKAAVTVSNQWNSPVVKNIRKSTMEKFRHVLKDIDKTIEKGINEIK